MKVWIWELIADGVSTIANDIALFCCEHTELICVFGDCDFGFFAEVFHSKPLLFWEVDSARS